MGPDRLSSSLTGAALPGGLRLGHAVAAGASGTIYRGWHDRAGAVAVKVSHADDDWTATRTMREANAAAALDDAGIVRVVAAGRLDDGRAWVAMEWIDGVTLEDALASDERAVERDAGRPGSQAGPEVCLPLRTVKRSWPLHRVLGVAAQLARALAVAHAAGVVHRDLKPANVMLRRGSDRVVVVDFGIARRAGDPASSASRCAGTPHYMAPEQAMGEDADARADLYALGCVLVKMITGRVPFEGSSVEVMLAHLGQTPPLLTNVPPAVAALVSALLAKRPDERPATATAVAAHLDALAAVARASGPHGVDPFDPTVQVSTLPRSSEELATEMPPPRRRRPGRTGLISLFAAAAIMGVGAFAVVRHHLEPAIASPSTPSPRPGAPAAPPPVLPTAPDDPVMIVVDGGFSMRATLHGVVVAGGVLDVELAIWDDDDQPIQASQIAATLRSPGGGAVALGVAGNAGTFHVRQRVADAGEHVLTVFAPSGETTFAVRITVGARPSV